MTETQLSVEVHCLQPQWVVNEKSKYRIYVNDELLTERDWIWPQDVYIKENMLVELPNELMHTVTVKVVKSNPMCLTKLALRNLTLNGINQNDCGSEQDNLSFVLT